MAAPSFRQGRQQGIALLLFALLLFTVGATLFLFAWNGKQAQAQRDLATMQALQMAKEAVLGDAASYQGSAFLPGHLRCPERLAPSAPSEGQAQSSCNAPGQRLGRLPWSTLATERLVDGYGEPLWYAVSPGFSKKPINNTTPGQLQVDGVPDAAVAVIIAPGPPLPAQKRGIPGPTAPPSPADYLELGNAGGSAFVTGGPPDTFNDRVMVITQAELFRTVNLRVLAEIRGLDDQAPNLPVNGLRRYYSDNGQFPWADTDGNGLGNTGQATGQLPYGELKFDSNTVGWLTANNWFQQVSYTRISATSARIGIGSAVLQVLPCTTLPCP